MSLFIIFPAIFFIFFLILSIAIEKRFNWICAGLSFLGILLGIALAVLAYLIPTLSSGTVEIISDAVTETTTSILQYC